jgi:thiamine pyrophosphokinase
MRTALVFVGGTPPRSASTEPALSTEVRRVLEALEPDLVLAVDSGLHLALDAGWTVDRIVGDMDSVDPDRLSSVESAGATALRHPVDKDATDLELALEHLVEEGCESVVVVGSDGGRMDHLLGGALTLCSPRFASLRVQAWLGGARIVPVHDEVWIRGREGRLLSIIAVGGPALGVRTRGLRWPLSGERLEVGSSRGLSNEMLAEVAGVSVDGGCVAVVLPEEEPA